MHFDDVRELMGLAAGTSKGCDMVLEILGDIEIELRRVQDFLRDERSRYLTSEQADAVTEHGCQCRTLVKKTGECPHEH